MISFSHLYLAVGPDMVPAGRTSAQKAKTPPRLRGVIMSELAVAPSQAAEGAPRPIASIQCRQYYGAGGRLIFIESHLNICLIFES